VTGDRSRLTPPVISLSKGPTQHRGTPWFAPPYQREVASHSIVSTTACMSGRMQSERGPVGRLEPPGGVNSVPIPCSLGHHCDGEMPPKEAEPRFSPPQRGGDGLARTGRGQRGHTPDPKTRDQRHPRTDRAPIHPASDTTAPKRLAAPVPPPPLPPACMSGRTQSEKGPAGRLKPPVEVISIPIPCSLGYQCDGHLPREVGEKRTPAGGENRGLPVHLPQQPTFLQSEDPHERIPRRFGVDEDVVPILRMQNGPPGRNRM